MRPSYLSPFLRLSVLCVGLSSQALAGEACDLWMPGPLHNQPEGFNNNGIAGSSAIWTPPTGPTLLVVAGSIQTAGGVPIKGGLAAWDGASWRDLGGVDFQPQALAVYNNDLIVGGNFDSAGGVPATNIARFDGTSWHSLGAGLDGAEPPGIAYCDALAIYNGELIAGGKFQTAGGTTATNIARWNGTSWSPMGAGVGNPLAILGGVSALRVHNNNVLYIGGYFSTAGGLAASNIVQYNGTSYALMTSGTGGNNPGVYALNSFGNDLVVGGGFTSAGGLSVNHVARWTPGSGTNGTWTAMGAGLGGNQDGVYAFQPFNGQLVAGGAFAQGIGAWNGSTWVNLGTNLAGGTPPQDPRCFTLNVFNGNLIAAGNFTTAGGVTATNIAQWSGSAWSALQTPPPQVLAFDQLGSRFIAAGSFLQSTTSQTPAHNIIGWNGTTLTQVKNNVCCGEGTNGMIRALKGFTAVGIPHLIVGGDFTVAGNLAANRIAQYDQPQLAGAAWTTLGAGFNNSVHAIERFNGSTFAGGTFTQSGGTGLNRIARFDGANWVALGTGVNGPVYAMKVFNGFLYAGGEFTTAGGVQTGSLARWNGSAWTQYNGMNSMTGTVFALEVHNNKLYVGGSLGGLPNILEFDGNSTSALGIDGTPNGTVNAMKTDGTNLYVGGGFTAIGAVSANHVARWNATDDWSDVSGGTDDVIDVLGLYHGEIQVGLGISLGLARASEGGTANPAPEPGNGWVRYTPTGAPWITSNPSGQTVSCGQTATFTATPAQGYSLLLATWRRNGVALNDGATPHGSTISGAHAGTLVISNARTADAGSYDCVFSNLCGSATSAPATLTVNNCCDPDITGNNVVNSADLLAVINSWGVCSPPPAACPADIAPSAALDGIVNSADLLAVINGWGACP